MPTTVQFRRGTSGQNNSFTGNAGEISYDTTNETLRVHDGSNAGGSRLAKYVEVTDRLQVANAAATYSTLTQLGNTNSYIATESARIDLVNTNLTSTNTAIRALVSDRLQVANATATFSTLAQLGNTNSYIAGVQSNLDATNANVDQKLGATATVTLTGDVSGSASFSSNSVSITTTISDDSHNHSSSSGAFTVGTDLTVSGGDIILSGTGRIQGIDTVSAGTDATNKTYVDNAVASVVDSAPEALNTLNELAAALGDDANFATTTATTLGTKAANSYVNATFSTLTQLGNTNSYIATKLDASEYTASDVLTKIKTVDGAGSGLDADTLDGNQATAFATAAQGALADSAVQNLSDLSITATAAEINKLDGVTATTTELNYIDGVTSAIQTQLNGKQATITGAATTIDTENLTVNRALVSDGSGKVAVSAVTSTEVGYLDGVTSAIQTQLNGKLATPSATAGASSITTTMSNVDLSDEVLVNPVGYITINIGGTNYKLPYYSA